MFWGFGGYLCCGFWLNCCLVVFILVWVFCGFDCFGLCVDCILEIGFLWKLLVLGSFSCLGWIFGNLVIWYLILFCLLRAGIVGLMILRYWLLVVICDDFGIFGLGVRCLGLV